MCIWSQPKPVTYYLRRLLVDISALCSAGGGAKHAAEESCRTPPTRTPSPHPDRSATETLPSFSLDPPGSAIQTDPASQCRPGPPGPAAALQRGAAGRELVRRQLPAVQAGAALRLPLRGRCAGSCLTGHLMMRRCAALALCSAASASFIALEPEDYRSHFTEGWPGPHDDGSVRSHTPLSFATCDTHFERTSSLTRRLLVRGWGM